MGRSLDDLIGKIEKFKDTEGNISSFYFKKTGVIHYNLFGIIPLGKRVEYATIPSFTRDDGILLKDRIEKDANCKVEIVRVNASFRISNRVYRINKE